MKPEYRKMFSKEDAIPPKVITAIFKGHEDFFICRACGYNLGKSRMTAENYCANCGQKVKHYSYGGIYCWTEKTAEKEWQKEVRM